jgi:hypothetical protein
MNDSGLGRLLGVLVSPGKTFRSIAARPTWWAALLVIVLSTLGVSLLAAPKMDYEDIIRQQIAKSGREVPQEQLDKQIEIMQKVRTPLMAVNAVVLPLGLCLLTLIPWAAFKLQGSDMDYARGLSATLHAFMPMVVAALLSIPVVLSRPSLGYADIRAGSFLKSNLAAVLGNEQTSAPVYALLSSLDVFSLWMWALLILGYREVAQVSTAKAATTMAVLWVIFVGLKVGWASIFG